MRLLSVLVGLRHSTYRKAIMKSDGLFLLRSLENFECEDSVVECRVCLILMTSGGVRFVVPFETLGVLVRNQCDELIGDFCQISAT